MDKIKILSIVCLMIFSYASFGQSHQINDTIHQRFIEMKKDPSKYASEEIVNIYSAEVMRYASFGMDTLITLFQEMKSFGNAIDNKVVIGMANLSIASTMKMQGNHNGLEALYKSTILMLKDHRRHQINAINQLGQTYVTNNQLDSAMHYCQLALSHALTFNDSTLISEVYETNGSLNSKLKKYNSAINQYIFSLKYSGAKIYPLRKCNLLKKISNQYNNVGDELNAIKYVDAALAISENNSYELITSELYLYKTSYLMALNKYEEAKYACLSALPYQQKLNIKKGLLNAYSKLATICTRLKQIDEAEKYLLKAEPFLQSEMGVIHKAPYYQANGYVLLDGNHFSKSIASFNQYLAISEQMGDEKMKETAFIGLKENYVKQGKWKEAHAYGDSILNLNKRLELANQKKLILDLESKYETELKESQINALNSKGEVQKLLIEKKNKQLMYFGVSLLLAGLALYGFYMAYMNKNRSNIALNKKNNQLIEALENNKLLVKEIHHRVKNNLQVVSSLLNLQSRFEQDNSVIKAINTGKYRVQSMSLLHQSLYLNEDLNSIHIKKYFEDLAKSIVKGYPLFGKEVKLDLDIEDIQLDVDTVVPLGLIANELITNSLKYAYDNTEHCELYFSIKESDNVVRLIVKDNGKGIGFTELPERSTSMGMQLIKSFANKIKSKIEIDNFRGTEFKFTFVIPTVKSNLKVIKNVAS